MRDGLVTNRKAVEHASAIASKLNAHGVTHATVQRLAPSALTVGPYDLLAHMR